ncbi:MAG TPA: hypothetical protein GX399_14630 [Xanthomonadaceae bacterium]|nr:hypothetical protein [Xanthomonadaceae bacterium]
MEKKHLNDVGHRINNDAALRQAVLRMQQKKPERFAAPANNHQRRILRTTFMMNVAVQYKIDRVRGQG